MIRAHFVSALAVAGLLAACSSTPSSTTYYAPGAAPVSVAGTSATYSAGTGTVAGGLNNASTADRVIVGQPSSTTPIVEGGTASSSASIAGTSQAGIQPSQAGSAPAATQSDTDDRSKPTGSR